MLMQRTTRIARRVRGFTLIELVIAVALLGTLIALGVPSFTAWIGNSQVRTVADSLQNGLRLAQTEAVRRNRTVVFSLTNAQPALNSTAATNGKFWAIQSIAQFGDAATDLFVQGGALTEVAANVTITSAVKAVCFNSNGRLATVALANTGVPGASCATSDSRFDIASASSDRALSVYLGLAGQVHLCDPKRPTLSDSSPDGCP